MFFDNFDPKERLVIDVETISYDDSRGALKPYDGDKIAGIAIAQKDHSIYLPIRHRTDMAGCFDFNDVMTEFTKFAPLCRRIDNVNVKFDLHNLAQDGLEFPNAEFGDLGTLARIVYNNYLERYNLDFLTRTYNKVYKKESDYVKQWCKEHNTQDYGAVPLPIMEQYARLDALSAYELGTELFERLPKGERGSEFVWDNERKFTRNLFNCERVGFEVDRQFLEIMQAKLCIKLDRALQKISRICKYDLNPASHQQVNEFFVRRGVEPVEFNEQKDGSKTPSWNSDALSQIVSNDAEVMEFVNTVMEYNEHKVAYSTFAHGWCERISRDGRIHPHFNQSGTKTGRVSSSDPNLQNPPPWIFEAIKIPEGHIGVKFDYSQIEYRIFAHYSGDEHLVKLYAENPKIDFHQIIADRLGMSEHRDPVKPINFGVLYGMGKRKMKKQLAKTIHDIDTKNGDHKLRDYLSKKYGQGSENLEVIGEAIIDEYHRINPAVKGLLGKVKQIIHARGNIRNLYNRYFQFDIKFAYVALNYLCQGSAADMFKDRVNAILDGVKHLNVDVVTNIHDSLLATMPIAQAKEYWEVIQREAGKVPISIPILVDGELYKGNWKIPESKSDKKKKKITNFDEAFNALYAA